MCMYIYCEVELQPTSSDKELEVSKLTETP